MMVVQQAKAAHLLCEGRLGALRAQPPAPPGALCGVPVRIPAELSERTDRLPSSGAGQWCRSESPTQEPRAKVPCNCPPLSCHDRCRCRGGSRVKGRGRQGRACGPAATALSHSEIESGRSCAVSLLAVLSDEKSSLERPVKAPRCAAAKAVPS